MGQFLGIGDGIKVGVAAIKTFLGQLLAFYGLVLAFEDRRGGGAIGHAPELLSQLAVGLRSMVHLFADTQDASFLRIKYRLSDSRFVRGCLKFEGDQLNLFLGLPSR